jgi:glucuronate isomerase
MSLAGREEIAETLYEETARWPIFDPHSHIDPRRPAARNFDEVLGYHYYTELAHSAGAPAELFAAGVAPRDRARHLSNYLGSISNTIQYSWLVEIARTFHDWPGDSIDRSTIDDLYDRAERSNAGTEWDDHVWKRSRLEAVFLTNEFDDSLEGWDTSKYIPCLRTDDLVLKLNRPATVDRLKRASGVDVGDCASLKAALAALFEKFLVRGARACAISLPPDFRPARAESKRCVTPIRRALHGLDLRGDEVDDVRRVVYWMLAELCADFKLPFDLMIGPVRDVYPAGVAGGRDLFDRRVSLYDYREVFNHFSGVTFPVSTLSPDAGGELTAYSWIFPNVVPLGHWWYSNIPVYIANDLRARLQAVPRNKIVGYYSDAYKLEFISPKFDMFRRVLSRVLAEDFVSARGWSIESALELAREILLENPRRIFAGGKRSS